MLNVHTRRFDAPVDAVRPWIEACWSGGGRDCFPRDVVGTWRKNPPGVAPDALVPGHTVLGHGPFRFRLREWDGTRWRVDVVGGRGWHGFDLAPDGDGCRVTHTLELEPSLPERLQWLLIGPIHDWVVEALFDRLAMALRTGRVPARSERPMPRRVAIRLALARRGLGRAASPTPSSRAGQRLPRAGDRLG
jgi:hypothetical protein